MLHKVYFFADESENGWLAGEFTWRQALEQKEQLLKTYASVSIDGVRYWA